MELVPIPTPTEVMNYGGDFFIKEALEGLRERLWSICSPGDTVTLRLTDLISGAERYPEECLLHIRRRVMEILQNKGWIVRPYEENGEFLLEIKNGAKNES